MWSWKSARLTTLRASRRMSRAWGAAAFTKTALDGGRTMGLTTAEMLAVIASLSRREFYKSMTTFSDHRVWQDVYHAATPVRKSAYITAFGALAAGEPVAAPSTSSDMLLTFQ